MEYIRQMDDLRRVIIPADFCNAFGWGTGTKLGFFIDESGKSRLQSGNFPLVAPSVEASPKT